MAGYVLFTFDDSVSYRQYSGAWQALGERGMSGTSYIVGGSVAGTDLAHMQEMYAAGWDIANHTWAHTNLLGQTQAVDQNEVRMMAEWLCANGMPRAAYHVSYPVGGHDSTAFAALAAEGMLSARTIDYGGAFVDASADDLHLLTFDLDYSSLTVAQAEAAVDEVAAAEVGSEKTLIFYGHGVPSFEGTGFTQDMYRLLANYVRDAVYSGDLRVVTISEWYELHKASMPGARTVLTYGGRNLNNGSDFSLQLGFDPGANVKTFDEVRGYGGSVGQFNVTEANLVDMTVPLRIQGASAADLRAKVDAINKKVDAGAQTLVHGPPGAVVKYACGDSPRVDYPRDDSAQGIFAAFVTLVPVRMPTSLLATGGTITTDGLYTVHTFTSSGTFDVPAGNTLAAELLVVGGGGGGSAGGGGAGGYLGFTPNSPNPFLLSGRIPVIVGLGGAGVGHDVSRGLNGFDSVFGTYLHARGGGGGGSNVAGLHDGVAGGSGGGGGPNGGLGGSTAPDNTQGHPGSTDGGFGLPSWPSGGGGGFSTLPTDAPDGSHGGDGGEGWDNVITGTSLQYCGGGGGSIRGTSSGGGAGSYGGGDGTGNAANGEAGTDGTGGGGGGAGGGMIGGKGGSGIVVVRYLTP